MDVRRTTYLRVCAGAAFLSLPVAASSSTAVSGATTTPVTSSATSSTQVLGHPFSGTLVTAAGLVDPVAAAEVARRVRAAGDQKLTSASPTRSPDLGQVNLDRLGIPRTAMVAYQVAATTMAQADPGCAVDWTLLAAIGRVESDHGRHAESELGADGVSRPHIRGVALDGRGPVAAIRDTDGGRLDGDKVWDRAVGPMQFLPSTWQYTGVDADGDGVRSPDNINDAALAAAVYLCAAPGSLDTRSGLRTAVHRYNPSDAYVDLVLRLAAAYAEGNALELPTGGTTLALGATEVGSSGGTMTGPSGAPNPGDEPGRQGSQGNGSGDNGGPGNNGGHGQGNDNGKGKGKNDGKSGAQVEDPVRALPGVDTEEPLQDFKPGKEPKPSEDPDPTPTPEPTDEPELGPVVVELTGLLTLREDQFWLEVYVDEVLAEEVLLDLGDEKWLAVPATGDLDEDTVVETNLEELSGLVALGLPVVLTVEEDTDPAVVRTVNGWEYSSPEE